MAFKMLARCLTSSRCAWQLVSKLAEDFETDQQAPVSANGRTLNILGFRIWSYMKEDELVIPWWLENTGST